MLQSVPHYMEPHRRRGGSPGNGMSPPLLSENPLATEEEVFRGFVEEERRTQLATLGDRRERRERAAESVAADGLDGLVPEPGALALEPRERRAPAGGPQTEEILPAIAAADGGGVFDADSTR